MHAPSEKRKYDEWIIGKTAAVLFGAAAALIPAALVILVFQTRRSSFPELPFYVFLVSLCFLFGGMHRYQACWDAQTARSRNIWFLVLHGAVGIGPIAYYTLVYLPQIRAMWRSGRSPSYRSSSADPSQPGRRMKIFVRALIIYGLIFAAIMLLVFVPPRFANAAAKNFLANLAVYLALPLFIGMFIAITWSQVSLLRRAFSRRQR